ncbi:hypothetical protein JZX87_30110 [Agrobacterium sp. Ap1]|uniref:hypothetical protein n=1 Tax=Agrobacterium sp. Ap1 TaxID=2815337 RepID=UPI000FA87142|nr:hypothetical protein [Agrobacterium sp. Ap1]MBO0145380.1 hypothetical protein [Agrobacterium sp. Ap1]
MTNGNEHPEQDPAEGLRETIERDLEKQDTQKETDETALESNRLKRSEAGAEAAEPSPGN